MDPNTVTSFMGLSDNNRRGAGHFLPQHYCESPDGPPTATLHFALKGVWAVADKLAQGGCTKRTFEVWVMAPPGKRRGRFISPLPRPSAKNATALARFVAE
jgi:hypothetical protein